MKAQPSWLQWRIHNFASLVCFDRSGSNHWSHPEDDHRNWQFSKYVTNVESPVAKIGLGSFHPRSKSLGKGEKGIKSFDWQLEAHDWDSPLPNLHCALRLAIKLQIDWRVDGASDVLKINAVCQKISKNTVMFTTTY